MAMDLPPIPPIPPEVTGAGLAAAAWGMVKLLFDVRKSHAERNKLQVESETAEILGEKAADEAVKAGVETLGLIVAQMRLRLDDLASQLQEEREHNQRFRSAVLKFIGRISELLPSMHENVRAEVKAAMNELQNDEAWGRS